MTNRERVLALIRSIPGLTDSEIRERTGIQPHQQVNQICRKLEKEGFIRRCLGREDRIVNLPRGASERISKPNEPSASRSGAGQRPRQFVPAPAAVEMPPLTLSQTLFVIPCSGKKRGDGRSSGRLGASMLALLPCDLADELSIWRAKNASLARIDESTLLPASIRYAGHLYRAADSAFVVLREAGASVFIISGGYGAVFASEPIGWYDRQFKTANWPNGLVGRCLAASADVLRAKTVVGLVSATTDYAKAFGRARWSEAVEQVFQVSPEATSGAMAKSPRAQGEALQAFSRECRLRAEWKSSDGLRMMITKMR